jgi:hypothetical protein
MSTSEQHKATPEQWDDAGAFASGTRACRLELRARVEALEAAQQPNSSASLISSLAGYLARLSEKLATPDDLNEADQFEYDIRQFLAIAAELDGTTTTPTES